MQTWKEELGWKPLIETEVLNFWFGLFFIGLGLFVIIIAVLSLYADQITAIERWRILILKKGTLGYFFI